MSTLNHAFTPARRLARTALSVERLTRVKDTAGVTFNDVLLALVGGSLRAYLQSTDELPELPLVASVPVAMDHPGASGRTFGNRFGRLTTTLGTDIADPWERLRFVSAVTADAKRLLARTGPELLAEWLDQLPPAVLDRGVRHHERRRRTHPEKFDANIVVSNIRGPRQPCVLSSAMVEEIYVLGPPNNGVGVNVVLMDYGDRVFVGVLSFADSVDAPAEITGGLGRALDDLAAAAEDRRVANSLTSRN
jgi:diacylglycerol O-acyltransferase / wax synthase